MTLVPSVRFGQKFGIYGDNNLIGHGGYGIPGSPNSGIRFGPHGGQHGLYRGPGSAAPTGEGGGAGGGGDGGGAEASSSGSTDATPDYEGTQPQSAYTS